jgi:hypothetical protein
MSKASFMIHASAHYDDAMGVISQMRTIIEHVRETGDSNLLPSSAWHVFKLADELVRDHETLIKEPV